MVLIMNLSKKNQAKEAQNLAHKSGKLAIKIM